jgi:hypothetical protein
MCKPWPHELKRAGMKAFQRGIQEAVFAASFSCEYFMDNPDEGQLDSGINSGTMGHVCYP